MGSQTSGSGTNGSNNTGNRANIDSNTKKILDKFPELFYSIGCLEDYEQSLHVDPTVSPNAQRPWRIPFHLRKQVSKLEEYKVLISLNQQKDLCIIHSSCRKPHNSHVIRLCGYYRRPSQA